LVSDGFSWEGVEDWSNILAVDNGDREICRAGTATEGIAERN